MFPHHSRAVYSAPARLVALYLVDWSGPTDAGWVCWRGLKTIARDCGVSVATVQRVMKRELVDGPRPLFKRTRGAVVTAAGRQHQPRTFLHAYVFDPKAFAQARDRARESAATRAPKPRPANIVTHNSRRMAAREQLRVGGADLSPAHPRDGQASPARVSVGDLARTVLRSMPAPDPEQAERTRRQIEEWRAREAACPSPAPTVAARACGGAPDD